MATTSDYIEFMHKHNCGDGNVGKNWDKQFEK